MKTMDCRILYVVPEKYPFFRADLTELFSEGVVKKNCQITWLLQSEKLSSTLKFKELDNERFIIYPSSANGFSRVIQSLCMYFRVWVELQKNQYDFVQVRDIHLGALIALLGAKFNGVPFIYWMSFPYAETYLIKAKEFVHESLLKRALYLLRGNLSRFIRNKIILYSADYVFVQSDRMKNDMELIGISSEKMMPVPMCVSLDKVRQIEKETINSESFHGKKVIAYLGTLARIRQPEFLLQVFASIIERFKDTVLLLIGNATDEDMDYLHKEVEKMGLQDNVVFTGFVPMEEAWAYVQCADVCLSPFRPSPILDSTTPTKLIEYLAFGKPVVVNVHPDQSKVIEESGAGLAVDYDVDAFVDAIGQLLDNPEKAKKMGAKGREYVRLHRTYDMLASTLGDKYLELKNKFSK